MRPDLRADRHLAGRCRTAPPQVRPRDDVDAEQVGRPDEDPVALRLDPDDVAAAVAAVVATPPEVLLHAVEVRILSPNRPRHG